MTADMGHKLYAIEPNSGIVMSAFHTQNNASAGPRRRNKKFLSKINVFE
jgi:hypothetical protein